MRPSRFAATHTAVSDALSAILPTSGQTWLLRACLHTGEAGRQAWRAYRAQVDDVMGWLRKDRSNVKSLMPLLFVALQRNGIVVEKELFRFLRIAYLRETLRARTYRGILRDVLQVLSRNDFPHIVLKSPALAETVYEDPALRHCDDINLLLPGRDQVSAASLLSHSGFTCRSQGLGSGIGPLTLMHESGLPLHLHPHLFCAAQFSPPVADLWARSQHRLILGIPTRLLAPGDNLLHVCVHAAFYSKRKAPRWVSDAWYILTQEPELNWDALCECAIAQSLALPLYVTLRYLAVDIQAAVPPPVLDRLLAGVSETDAIRSQATLVLALGGTGGIMKLLSGIGSGWRSRALVVRWMLFPSPSYMRSTFQAGHPWLLPLYYVYRPLRYVARRIWWRCRGHLQFNALQKHLGPPEVKSGG